MTTARQQRLKFTRRRCGGPSVTTNLNHTTRQNPLLLGPSHSCEIGPRSFGEVHRIDAIGLEEFVGDLAQLPLAHRRRSVP